MSIFKRSPIGSILEQIVTGSTPSTLHPEYFDDTIPWFTPSDIGISRDLIDSSRHISELALKEGKAKHFEKGMLLVTCIGEIGRVGVLQESASSNQQITALRFCSEVDTCYAYYWFIAHQHVLQHFASQAVIPILNNDRLKDIDFAYPPLLEQKHIAIILEHADRLRRLRRYTRELSDTYLQSVFLEMFGDPKKNPKGWDKFKAQDIFEIQLGKMLSEKNYTGKHLHPYLRNINVQWGYTDLTDINEMDFDEKEFKKYELRKGDILVCEGGEVGRTAIYQGEIEGCCYQNALHRLRIKKHVIRPEYFVQFMKAAANFGLISVYTSQVTIAHFTAEKLKEFNILIPPLPVQERFAKTVQKFERLQSQQRGAERQAEHLFQTLLHKAFKGGLVPST